MKRLALVGASVVLLAACGGGGNPAVAQITSAYTSFFSTKSSVDAHVALVEDGQKFKPVIQKFFANPLASGVSATVSKVTLQGHDKATVTYSVKVGGFALNNQTGAAVLQGGKWKIADSTLCGLVSLAGSPPAACKK
jgi:hypothetical protein